MSARDSLRTALSKRDSIAAEIAAAQLAGASISELQARLAEAELQVSNAALTAFRAERDEAHVAALEIIDSLVPHMARLVMAEHVRRAVVGDRYRFDAARHPPMELWSGEIAARAFAESVPDRLRPDAFVTTIEAAAESMAAEALASLKGNAK